MPTNHFDEMKRMENELKAMKRLLGKKKLQHQQREAMKRFPSSRDPWAARGIPKPNPRKKRDV